MKTHQCEFLILGSGIGGSLLAAVLAKAGRDAVLVDRVTHPRFAIGESSTPLADRTLLQIAQDFSLPELIPLTTYGTWKEHHPELVCGLKRGFSYFGHDAGKPFDNTKQLFAAASRSDDQADTHWLRSDVDEFLFHVVRKKGAQTLVCPDYRLSRENNDWIVKGTSDVGKIEVRARFVVDATGAAAVVLKHLNVPSVRNAFEFEPSSTYAHFADVPLFGTILERNGINLEQHPFPSDAAAVHHVLEDGWMWQLRFDDGSVSVGIMSLNQNGSRSPQANWQDTINRYPLLKQQFANARLIRPAGGLQHSKTVRRLSSVAAGNAWAALPGTVGFVDPLHSKGIAHTLFGVRRLAQILLATPFPTTNVMEDYSRCTIQELRHIGRLVDGCYAALPVFRLWSDWCMLYLAAITSVERGSADSFLLSSDSDFEKMLGNAREQLKKCLDQGATNAACEEFESWLKGAIAPWNTAGLMNPASQGIYATTAAPPLTARELISHRCGVESS